MDKTKNMWRILGGRKFLGFLLATLLCYTGKISGEIWIIAFTVYCGANVSQKIFQQRGE